MKKTPTAGYDGSIGAAIGTGKREFVFTSPWSPPPGSFPSPLRWPRDVVAVAATGLYRAHMSDTPVQVIEPHPHRRCPWLVHRGLFRTRIRRAGDRVPFRAGQSFTVHDRLPLRGLPFQAPSRGQDKLVRYIRGTDLRRRCRYTEVIAIMLLHRCTRLRGFPNPIERF